MKRALMFLLLIALAIQSTYGETKPNNELSFKEVPVPENMKAKLQEKFQASDGGNEFWCLFPPNDPRQTFASGATAIFVGSGKFKNTPVTIEFMGQIIAQTTIKDPYDCASFIPAQAASSGAKNPVICIEEPMTISHYNDITGDRTENSPINKGLRVYTDDSMEIYVYVFNGFNTSAENYMALPTSGLGNRYIHCSYSDGAEGSTDNAKLPGGFLCIAVYPDTRIQALVNFDNTFCTTHGGKKNGQTITSPLLQPGQIWNVANAYTAMGHCDLTGSVAWSDKNFAFISYNERLNLPTGTPYSRDNLCEQLLPTNKWGKKHMSVQMKGLISAIPNINPGDPYRIVAQAPSTTWKVVWYDFGSYEPTGTYTSVLNGEGKWQEYAPLLFNSYTAAAPYLGVCGAGYWESDKPIMLMQYAATTGVLYSSNTDPLIMLVPPLEQWGNNTTFVVPGTVAQATFDDKSHYFSLMALGPVYSKDTTDEYGTHKAGDPVTNADSVASMLGTIVIRYAGSSKLVKDVESNFYSQNIPGSPYYYARFQVKSYGVYRIDAKTKIAGQTYGWGGAISYGCPASLRLVTINEYDKLPPKLEDTMFCDIASRPRVNGRIITRVSWADTVDIMGDDFTDKQIDLGVNRAPYIVFDSTENLQVQRYYYWDDDGNNIVAPSTTWRAGRSYRRGQVEFNIKDVYRDVFAILSIEDEVGNESLDTIIYISDKINFLDEDGVELQAIDFGSSPIVGQKYNITVKLNNLNDSTTSPYISDIDSVFLGHKRAGSDAFQIESGAGAFSLAYSETHDVVISFSPTSTNDISDTLFVYTNCLYFAIPIYAGSGMPMIRVSDYDFEQVMVGLSKTATITIENPGSLDLHVTGWHWADPQDPIEGPFFYNPTPSNPEPSAVNTITVAPFSSQTVLIRNLRFKPADIISYSTQICFESDAAGPALDPGTKPCGNLIGEGIQVGPQITSFDWDERRVLTDSTNVVTLINTGNTPITIKEIPQGGLSQWLLNSSQDTLFNGDRSFYVLNTESYKGHIIYPHEDDSRPLSEREVNFTVGFRPQSEYVPYGTQPISVSFSVNFTAESLVNDNTCVSTLSGLGILPKIQLTGYKWDGKTMEGTVNPETGSIVIHNPSFTARLHIKNVYFDADVANWQEEDFIPGDPQINFWDSYNSGNVYVAKNESLEIPVLFAPHPTGVVNRVAKVYVDCDAMTGPEEDPTVIHDTLLEAVAFNQGLNALGYDYGTVTRCDNPTGQIVISNLSDNTPMEIMRIELVDTNLNNVFIITPPTSADSIVAPNSNRIVPFRFAPCNWVDTNGVALQGPITAEVYIETDVGYMTVELIANPLIIDIQLSVEKHPNIPSPALPSVKYPFPIDIKVINALDPIQTFANANIREFTITMKAPFKAVEFTGFDDVNGWIFNFDKTKWNATDQLITIHGSGPNAINGEGTVAIPIITLLLTDSNDNIPFHIVSADFHARNCCVMLREVIDGKVDYEICASPIRPVGFAPTLTGLKPITPNPYINGGSMTVEYSTAFDNETSLIIYNSAGQAVKTLANGFIKAGVHSQDVDISKLATGAYTIILRSGDVEDMQKVIILK